MNKPLNVLVVDDDEVDRLVYERYLQKSENQFKIDNAHTSAEGIRLCEALQPDCVLLDYNLPDMNGLECIKHLKANPKTKDIPIIMFTGNGAEETAVEAMKLGAKDYMVKNKINIKSLEDAILKCIEKAKDETAHQIKQEKLNQLAYQDELTGALKRHAFVDLLKKKMSNAHRNDNQIAILFIDIDNFKQVNDTYGHQKGDWLLKHIALNISNITRKDDLVCRYGGDEFIVCLSHIQNHKQMSIVANKLIQSIHDLNVSGLCTVKIGASIGVAVYPSHGEDVDTLIQNADEAMYCAKKTKNTYYIYQSENSDDNNHENNFEQMLNAMIQEKTIQVAFQPQYDIKRHSMHGIEAFMRAKDLDNNYISPELVLSTAKRVNKIYELSCLVHEQAIQSFSRMQDQNPSLQKVMLNVTADELYDNKMAHHLMVLTNKYHIHPHNVEIEINQDVFWELEKTIQAIKHIQQLGFRVAVDNYGNESISLQKLSQVMPNSMSIDPTFMESMLQNDYDLNIVKSILDLGKQLNIDIVAKRIETAEHEHVLTRLGFEYMQGYYYSMPVEIEDLIELSIKSQQKSS